jgi:hypothetical protein
MPEAAIIAVGSQQALTGAGAPILPAHAIDDILVCAVNTSAQALGSLPAGWAHFPESPQSSGAAATAGSAGLSVIWKRAVSAAESNPSIGDSGDHQMARCFVVRGVPTGVTPYIDSQGDANGGTSTSVTFPTVDTGTETDCLIVNICSDGLNISGSAYSSPANASLESITEVADHHNLVGLGGGMGIFAGVKRAAGVVGATTATLSTAARQARLTIAFKGTPEPTEPDPGPGLSPVPPLIGGSSAPRSPTFIRQAIQGATNLAALIKVLALELPRLAAHVMYYERIALLAYGTTVRPSGNASRYQYVRVTNTSGFTIAAPELPREGVIITLDIHNGSGGAMGVITWDPVYELTVPFVNPADGKHRLIEFYRRSDGKWAELARSNSDLN